jgi:hypothetical protein
MGLDQPPVQWVRGGLSPGEARPGRDADLSLPCSSYVKNEKELYFLPLLAPAWRNRTSSVIFIFTCSLMYRSRVSSGSIVSDWGLDDRAIGVRSQAEAKDFSTSLFIQTGSGSHPDTCPMGTGGPFTPGVKCGRGVTLTTHPHLVPRSWMSRSYTSSPPSASISCSGTALLFTFTCSLMFNFSFRELKPSMWAFRFSRRRTWRWQPSRIWRHVICHHRKSPTLDAARHRKWKLYVAFKEEMMFETPCKESRCQEGGWRNIANRNNYTPYLPLTHQ